MAITKQRISKLEKILGLNEKREVKIILVRKMGDERDQKMQRDFINREIKKIKKKGGHHLLPQYIFLDKDAGEAARKRVEAKKRREKRELLQPSQQLS